MFRFVRGIDARYGLRCDHRVWLRPIGRYFGKVVSIEIYTRGADINRTRGADINKTPSGDGKGT